MILMHHPAQGGGGGGAVSIFAVRHPDVHSVLAGSGKNKAGHLEGWWCEADPEPQPEHLGNR